MTQQLATYLRCKNQENSAVKQNYDCKYCGTKFHKESSVAKHICVKKRRHMEINTQESRIGFRAFQRFFEITMSSKKQKTCAEFIDSPYYIDFVKFGNHIVNLKPVYPEQFIDFVINNSVKLKDWTKDYVYDTYINALVKKEPADSAVERSITEIIKWTDNNNTPFVTFFSQITANEASYLIRTGKISPWVLYLSDSGGKLVERFNMDHSNVIGDIIDPGYWVKKFKNNEDVAYVKTLLAQAGI